MTVCLSAAPGQLLRQRLPLAGVVASASADIDAVRDQLAPGDFDFIGKHVSRLDPDHQRSIARAYRKTVERCRGEQLADMAGARAQSVTWEANDRLRDYVGTYQIHDLCLTASDSEIVTFCDNRATECRRIISGNACDGRRLRLLCAVIERYRMKWPAPWSELEFGPVDLQPFLKRLECVRWWRRQVRKLQAREVERVAIMREEVGRGRDLYCSGWTARRHQRAKKRNRDLLARVRAENDDGQAYTLDELSLLGTGNPRLRRMELMTRMRGFEEVSQLYGHAGEFWTFTTPSRFHRMTVVGADEGKRGFSKPNKNWVDATPADGQQWLCRAWARVRAAMDRAFIRCYGFRVAEPHHDGTPHWHLVLFFEPGQVRQARRIARHYMLADSPTEKGARRRRFTAKAIDPTKGSATGYISKYISKNINGDHLAEMVSDEDSGVTSMSAAKRVQAWANTWGIRQFQQIGGPSVTVWRELRRLNGYDVQQRDLFVADWLDDLVEAADAGDWFGYCMAMGGPNMPRDCRPVVPAYWLNCREYKQTGEMVPVGEMTEYGDVSKGSVFGVLAAGFPILTRFYRWSLSIIRTASEAVRNLQFNQAYPPDGFDLLRRASAPPRTCVNNCTG